LALLNHPLPRSKYNSVLLNALATLGQKPNGGWAAPYEYTPHYSAVLKIARLLVVLQSEQACDEAVAKGQPDEGLFARVRGRTQRFLSATGEGSQLPTPIGWILSTRAYGLKIRFTTAIAG
ncbi:hypothetical protein GQ53DRAFT_674001, partial [Thozetella sp. PMI_491]